VDRLLLQRRVAERDLEPVALQPQDALVLLPDHENLVVEELLRHPVSRVRVDVVLAGGLAGELRPDPRLLQAVGEVVRQRRLARPRPPAKVYEDHAIKYGNLGQETT